MHPFILDDRGHHSRIVTLLPELHYICVNNVCDKIKIGFSYAAADTEHCCHYFTRSEKWDIVQASLLLLQRQQEKLQL